MIERFNFYDIYGYLIPGAVTIIIYSLPFVFLGTFDLSSWPLLAIGILAAYIVGHLLQSMASTAMPSSRKAEREFWRAPSATILNASDKTFTPSLKANIEVAVRNWFNLEVQVSKDVDETVGRVRQDAFFQARLIATESSSYPEQFQGLYTMMRGLTVACWFGSIYMTGWAAALWWTWLSVQIAVEVLGVTLLAALVFSICQVWEMPPRDRESSNRISLVMFGLASAGCGYTFGIGRVLSPPLMLGFVAIAALYLAASFRFLNAYWYFAVEFAKAVWRNFATGPATRPTPK